MARHGFAKRAKVKSGRVVKLNIDNEEPLGSSPKTTFTEPGQDGEASDYPAKPSRTNKVSRGERNRSRGSSGSIGIETTGKGRAGV